MSINITDAQYQRLGNYNEEELKQIEAVPILMAMSSVGIEDTIKLIKPEWCVRREVAQMYQVIKSTDKNAMLGALAYAWNDAYVEKARQHIDIYSVSVKAVADKMRDGYLHRESTQAISAYLNATTPSARQFNLKRLEQLEEMMMDDGPVRGLEIVDMQNRSPKTEYCLKLGDIFFCPRRDITAIKGRAKHGKTHLICILIAALLGRQPACGIDVANHERQLRILYADTEQSLASTEMIVEKSLAMAGLPVESNSPYCKAINLRKVAKTDRKKAIEREVGTGRFDVVIVDGIKDLCVDFNDLKEADQLMVDVLAMVDTYNVSYITVLHENPGDGTNKMRGHLGTEVENKAYEVFEAKRNEDVFNVHNTERRSKMIPTFAFRFNDDDEIEACEPNDKTGTSPGPSPHRPTKEEKAEAQWRQFRKSFEDNRHLSLTQKEICDNMVTKCEMPPTTTKRRIELYLAEGRIKKDGEGQGARFYLSPAEQLRWDTESALESQEENNSPF